MVVQASVICGLVRRLLTGFSRKPFVELTLIKILKSTSPPHLKPLIYRFTCSSLWMYQHRYYPGPGVRARRPSSIHKMSLLGNLEADKRQLLWKGTCSYTLCFLTTIFPSLSFFLFFLCFSLSFFLSGVRLPSVKSGFSETAAWIQTKFYGKLPIQHISRPCFCFFKIFSFQFFLRFCFRFR